VRFGRLRYRQQKLSALLTNINLKKGRLEDWKIGRLKNWKIGKLENWKIGKLSFERLLLFDSAVLDSNHLNYEGWKVVRWQGCKVGSSEIWVGRMEN
jgi:hypothetical protein